MIKCPECKSENTYKNGKEKGSGKQKYICKDCSKNFYGDAVPGATKLKVGMTLDEFRDRHDVEHIITKTLEKLDPDMIYEKADLIKIL